MRERGQIDQTTLILIVVFMVLLLFLFLLLGLPPAAS